VDFKACRKDDARPCELKVSLGYAQDIGKELGLDTRAIDEILDRGAATEDEVKTVLDSFRQSVPEDYDGGRYRMIADTIYCVTFPDSCPVSSIKEEIDNG